MTSVFFLAIMILIPLFMIGILLAMLMRKISGNNGIQNLTYQQGWSLQKDSEHHPLQTYINDGFFSLRKGEHSLKNIISLAPRLWVCDYHYLSPGTTGRRRGGDYSLAIIERTNTGPNLWVLRRTSGPLGKVAEIAASGQLQPLSDPQWSWLLSASPDGFTALGWSRETAKELQNIMEPGDGLFLLENFIIFSKSNCLNKKRILDMKQKMERIRSLLG